MPDFPVEMDPENIVFFFYRLLTNTSDLWFPPTEERKATWEKFEKNSRIFISEADKIVYKYFFGKLKFLLKTIGSSQLY